jgi:hypothetical protein
VRVADRCCDLILLLMQHFLLCGFIQLLLYRQIGRSVYSVELIMERGRRFESTELQVVTVP